MEGWHIIVGIQIVSTIVLAAFQLGNKNNLLKAIQKDVGRNEERITAHGKVLDRFEGRISHIEGKMNGFLKGQ